MTAFHQTPIDSWLRHYFKVISSSSLPTTMYLQSVADAQENVKTTPASTGYNDTSVPSSAQKILMYDVTVILTFVLVGSICVLCIALLIWACSRQIIKNKIQERRDSDKNVIYENMNIRQKPERREPVETFVYRRPLPSPPVSEKHPGDTTSEDDYLTPNSLVYSRQQTEIKNLPPAPPVFPERLKTLQLEGEGDYLTLIPDDTPPLTPSSPLLETIYDEHLSETHEADGYERPRFFRKTSDEQNSSPTEHPRRLRNTRINIDDKPTRVRPPVKTQRPMGQLVDGHLSETHEADGYVRSRLLRKTSDEQNSSPTEHPRRLKNTRINIDDKPTRARPPVKTPRPMRQLVNVSEFRSSVAEDTSLTTTTKDDAEPSNGEKSKRFTSEIHIQLSPLTQNRGGWVTVTTCKPNVVVCKRTN
ncbi:uncharacterized protein LOC110841381 isoform X2 [Zootermopsis nevadensis]|nr:uncharacterized protein LOC110841381 isoform X2 [Zootermopsis nevadensis]